MISDVDLYSLCNTSSILTVKISAHTICCLKLLAMCLGVFVRMAVFICSRGSSVITAAIKDFTNKLRNSHLLQQTSVKMEECISRL